MDKAAGETKSLSYNLEDTQVVMGEMTMHLQPQITFRNMDPSPAIESKVLQRIDRLERFYPDIMHCRVVIEIHHRHHHQGKLFHVVIDVTVPGHQLISGREPSEHHAHEDVYVAIRDAFDAMDRQLEDFSQKQRGETKKHEQMPHGRIDELHAKENYGRILTQDGRYIYFHSHSLIGSEFGDLQPGDEVRFVEEAGDLGPQASSVFKV